jgi:hypothetical protein
MGMQTLLLGYIEEAWPGLAAGGDPVLMQHLLDTDRQISRHNEEVLGSLPEADEWPPLCRAMFSWASADAPMIVYRNRILHLGASLKDLERAARDWLDKFEGLLRRLYWESAYVRCEFGLFGVQEFRWRPLEAWVKELCQGRLFPIPHWSFESTLGASDLEQMRE